nr:immunoglobulin light chain junction region [Macaca mulatta]
DYHCLIWHDNAALF